MKLPADLSPDKILVVDDNEDVATMIETLLKKGGYEVHTANDGDVAFELLEEHAQYPENDFDLVITDQEMPNMLGSELIANIRDDPDFKSLKVILITTLPQDDFQDVSFDSFMQKPLDLVLLLGMVRDLLSE